MLIKNVQRINTGTGILWVAGHYSSKLTWGETFLYIGERSFPALKFSSAYVREVFGVERREMQLLTWMSSTCSYNCLVSQVMYTCLSSLEHDTRWSMMKCSLPFLWTQDCQFGTLSHGYGRNLEGHQIQWSKICRTSESVGELKPQMLSHYLNRSEMGPRYLWFFKSLSGDIHSLKIQM